ncbi:hypothetical protein Trydic_g6494 [Trypoxylus dichotomus]
MEMTDKAVSTEDLCYDPSVAGLHYSQQSQRQPNSTCIEVARLEGVLNTLLENKVEAIKNDRTSSLHSSPKMLLNRFRIISTTSESVSSKDKDSAHSQRSHVYRKHRRRKNSDEIGLAKPHKSKRSGRTKQRISSPSPESPGRYTISRCCERSPQHSDEEANQAFLPYQTDCHMDDCHKTHHHCCCRHDNNADIQMTFDEDYVSLRIDDFGDFDDIEEDVMMTHEALKRARRKRRKRRKRRMKRQLAIAALPVEENVKVLDPDELPQRARWTIVATACLLLFMCLLLVGVTLRMAPIIDDMGKTYGFVS